LQNQREHHVRKRDSVRDLFSVTGFLLTRHWRDGPGGVELVFWAHSSAGPLRLVFRGQQVVCFTPADTALDPADLPGLRLERKRLRLRALDGPPVDGLYLRHQRDLGRLRAQAASAGIPLYESDVKPHDRFLMERFITATLEVAGEAVERRGYLEFHNPGVRPAACEPHLSYVSLDIETDGIDWGDPIHRPVQQERGNDLHAGRGGALGE